MALGGGNFTTMNKVIPGAYINVISKTHRTDVDTDRGIAAMALPLSWGPDGECFSISADELISKAPVLLGYDTDADEMLNIREIFKHAKKLIIYKLGTGGTKATNTYADAVYTGTRGNDLKLTISANADDTSKFDVVTKLGKKIVDKQTVATADDLVANQYVTFKSGTTLEATVDLPFAGGTNGTVDGAAHSAALTAFEAESFHVLGVDTTDDTIKALYVAFTKRMREEVGVKFSLVCYKDAADHEGVIDVETTVSDEGASEAALVYWVTGAEAGCSVPGTCTNMIYDGEYTIKADLTQAELEEAGKSGKFVFHKVGDDYRVLLDINSLVTYTDTKNELFARNETIRTIDILAMNVANIFNKSYLGLVLNNADGRMSLWSSLCTVHKALENSGAINSWNPDDLTVTEGEGKGDVVVNDIVTVAGTMEKLYMTVVID